MKILVCPLHILKLFDDESTKAKGRLEAIKWLKSQDLKPGQEVLMPNPNTGELEAHMKGPEGSAVQ